jgi:long-subunit acyl-CoA synthetase (AMP-forming)
MKHSSLKHIIQLDGESVSPQHLQEFGNVVSIYHITEIERMGEEQPSQIVIPQPDALFTVMYTSGSTGRPKVRLFAFNREFSITLLSSSFSNGHW